MLQAGRQRLVLRLPGGNPGLRAAQIHHLSLRRVTQASISTALPTDLDLTAGASRNQHFNLISVHLRGTKELIAVLKPLGHHRLMGRIQTVELETLLIEIVTIGDFPVQASFAGRKRLGGEHKGFFNRQEIWLAEGVARAPGMGQAGQTYQQQRQQHTHV